MTNITLPNGLVSIGDYAFYLCTLLTNINIPEGVTSIGNYAFGSCTSLTNIIIPSTAKSINQYAFKYANIKKLIIEDGAKIPETTITQTSSQDDIMIIPQSVTSNFQVIDADTIYYKTGTIGETIAKRDASIAIPDDEPPKISVNRDTTQRGVSSVTITLNATDDIVGLHSVAYSFDGGETWQSENTKTYTNNVKNEQVQVRDIVGNVATASFSITNINEKENSWDISEVENSGQVWADLYIDGTLEIRGQGNMKNFNYDEETPWKDSHIKKVIIQDGVTNIGSNIFSSEYRLKEVTIADSVTSIGSSAFDYCIALAEITLPNNLVNIGRYAFEGCNQLTNITIPEKLTTIGEGAFSYCEKLTDINVVDNNTTYSSVDGVLFNKDISKLILYPYARKQTEYTIPDTVETIGVSAFDGASNLKKLSLPEGLTTIEESAFMNCTGINEVILPSTLTTIGKYAFGYCYKLDNIEIPGNVATINSYVFEGCGNLKSVTLLDGITTIKDYAFENCSNLYEIYIPTSLNKISYLTFSGCSSLEYINVSENNPNYSSEDGILYDKDKSVLIVYPSGKTYEEYAIKDGIVGIYEYAFNECNYLKAVAIPSSVLEIEDSAFYKCYNLQKAIIPDQVTYIGEYAFEECNKALTIYCRSNSYAETYAEDLSIAYQIDNEGPTITGIDGNPTEETWDPVTLTINAEDEGAGLIGKVYSFDSGKTWIENNSNTFKANGIITVQARDALGNVSETQKVSITEINSDVARIGTWDISKTENDHVEAALYTNKVVVISGTGEMADGINIYTEVVQTLVNNGISNLNGDLQVIIKDGVTNIGIAAFNGWTHLGNISIASSVVEIGSSAFYNCSNLFELTIPEGVKNIDSKAFYKTGLIKVNLPSTLEKGQAWFDSGRGTSFMFESYGDYMTSLFYNCDNLQQVNISNSDYKSKDGVVFDTNSRLVFYPKGRIETEYSVPEGTVEIVSFAFKGANNLKKISIPESVNNINHIDNCAINLASTILSDLGVEEKTDISKNLVEIDVDANNKTYVSENGIVFTKDKTKLIWYPEGKTITEYIIPSMIKTIGTGAFSACNNIQIIHIPEGLEKIELMGFGYSTNLDEIDLPSTVTSIGEAAFIKCSNLTTISLTESVESIEMNAFYLCESLTNVTIPSNIKKIEGSTFYGTKLTDVVIPIGVTTIEGSAFKKCTELERIVIPSTVETMGNYILNNSDNATIYCQTGSTAEEYATSNQISYVTDDDAPTIENVETVYDENSTSATIKVSASDAVVGLAQKAYSFDGGKTWQASSEKTYKRNKTGISVQVRDALGNISEYEPFDITEIDESQIVEQSWNIGADENNEGAVVATLRVDGSLVISGTGNMKNWTRNTNVPWYGEDITSVEIQSGVTNIGDYAFAECSDITSATISEGVITIGKNAFSGCNSLEDITIPTTVTTIGNNAFARCSGLIEVKLPEGVTTIGTSVFSGCSSLTTFTIPSTLKTISSKTFYGCESLENVTIANGVTSIGTSAFEGCSALTEITIPSTVATISDSAFANCSGLTNIALSEGVKTIGGNAFKNCSSLATIEIPSTTTSISNTAFTGCSGLQNINVDENNTKYSSINGVLFNKDKTELICYPCAKEENAYEIPNTVKIIGNYAFENSKNLENVTIPSSVTTIEEGAFSGCANITEYTIPNSVTNIGSYAFEDNSSLERITLPENITTISAHTFSGCSNLNAVTIPSGVTSIEEGAFSGCSSIQEMTLPDGLTTISEYAFESCTSLTNVEIPLTVNTIGQNAFENCSELETAIIPNKVSTIGTDAFVGCDNLTIYCGSNSQAEVYATENEINYIVDDDAPVINNVTKNPEGWTSQGVQVSIEAEDTGVGLAQKAYRFDGRNYQSENTKTYTSNTTIYNVYVVDKIGNIATGTQTITIDNVDTVPPVITNILQEGEADTVTVTVEAADSQSGLADEAYSFDGGINWQASNQKEISKDNLKIVVIVKDKAGNTQEEEVVLNGEITWKIGATNVNDVIATLDSDGNLIISGTGNMKNWNTSEPAPWENYKGQIKSVEIQSGVTNAGDYAFNDCNNLTIVKLAEGIQNIGESAFENCTSLSTVTIPSSVTTIGDYAFHNTGLTQATIPENVTEIGNMAFHTSTITDINVDVNNTNYSDTDGVLYNKDKTILVYYPAGRTDISLNIPSGVTRIASSAIVEANYLEEIIIPMSVTTINDNAISQCENLNKVTIPKEVTNISTSAINNCENISIYCQTDSKAQKYANDNQITCVIDDEGPTIVSQENTPTTWTNGTVTITVVAQDEKSGMTACQFTTASNITASSNGWKTMNSTVEQISSETFTIKNGTYYFYAMDALGNITQKEIQVENIDTVKPTISQVTGNPTTWTNETVTLTVEAQDANSGIASYSFDNGTTWQESNSKTFSENKEGIIIKVKDVAGNETTYSQTINITKIDKTPPTIKTVNGIPTGVSTKNVTLTIDAEDNSNGSGLAQEAYSFDNGATWQASNAKTYNVTGTYAITIKVKDSAGNETTYNTINMEIQKTTSEEDISSDYYQIESPYISGVQPGTTVADLKNKIDTNGNEIEIVGTGNESLSDTDLVTTGTKVIVYDKEVYTVVVWGDVTGDGKVDKWDLAAMNKHRMNWKTNSLYALKNEYFLAGDVATEKGIIDHWDMSAINKYMQSAK